MEQNKYNSFSLLSQEEIDTLVRFLTDKKNTFNSDVMSQTSIDKLIRLIQTDGEHLILNTFMSYGNIDSAFFQELHFRASKEELCELKFSVNPDTQYVELLIENKETEKTLQLTPKLLNKTDADYWGYSIAPVVFTHIAYTLSLKYTQETYDSICTLYAKHNFGSDTQKLPELYLAENTIHLACLL